MTTPAPVRDDIDTGAVGAAPAAKMASVCGIGALLGPTGADASDAGRRMVDALRHRGPDGEGVRHIEQATLVHTRLAIIDVAGGDQPLMSEDGNITAVVNGELYNHGALRAELERDGHVFATGSDSEVVVHGYERDGIDFVRRLNGIFAFVLWDAPRRRLIAARDHFGVKPLYWTSDGKTVGLASEIGALIAAGLVEPRIDRVALDHYLACRFVPAPRTLFEGVSKLPAATTLTVEPGSSPRVESFREAPDAPLEGLAADDLASELSSRFSAAVQRQMMSQVPYGAFLSGGVDSAAVVAAMAAHDGAPKTFTIGFPGHGDVLDERRYAADSARAIGSEHHDTALEQSDFVPELQRCVRHLEEPCGIPSAGALMSLSRFASGSVKVVLSGQGADEPHGGYGRHRAAAALGLAGPLARGRAAWPLRAALRQIHHDERAGRAARLLGPMPDAQRLMRLVEITDEDVRRRLVGGDGAEAERERTELAAAVLCDVGDRSVLDRALYLDSHLLLGDGLLICADKMSMAASLEQRVPFLDLELMRFVERIPASARASSREGKRLHRRAMGRLVPREIVERPKHGFSTPYDDWLRDSLGDEVRERYAPGTALSQLIAPQAVADLVDAHRARSSDNKRILYCLLELSAWHATFIEGVAA